MARNDSFPTSGESDISGEDVDDEGDTEFDDIYETAEIAIPFALAIVVIVVLCVTLAFAKMRKRRLRRERNGQAPPVPALSGGVPMNAAAYLNQEFHNNIHVQPPGDSSSHLPNSTYRSPPPPLYTTPGTAIEGTPMQQYNPIPYSPMMEPPKYEDIYKEQVSSIDVNTDEQIVQGSTEESAPHDNDNPLSNEHIHGIRPKDSGDSGGIGSGIHASDNKAFQADNDGSSTSSQQSGSQSAPQSPGESSPEAVQSQGQTASSSDESAQSLTTCL